MSEVPPPPGSREAVRSAASALEAARRSWESGVSTARRSLADAEKSRGKEISRRQKAIEKARKPKMLASVGTATLHDDHLEVGGRSHPLVPGVSATVEVGSKERVFLRIQGPDWAEVVELNEKAETQARSFAADLEVAAANAKNAKEARSAEVAQMEQALAALSADTTAVDEAKSALSAAEANTADLRAAADTLDTQLNATSDTSASWYRQAVKRLGKIRQAANLPAPVGSKAAAAYAAGEGSDPFWRRWTKGWRLAVTATAGVFIVLFVVAGIFGSESEADSNDSVAAATTTEQTEAAPATQAAAPAKTAPAAKTTTAKAKPKPKPKPKPSPGALSEWDYEQGVEAIADVTTEISDYGQKVGAQCSRMYAVGQVSEGIDCVNDAYDGVESKIEYAAYKLDDLSKSTTGKCKRITSALADTLNRPLYQAAKNSKEALDNFDGPRIEPTTKALTAQIKRLNTYSVKMIATCEVK